MRLFHKSTNDKNTESSFRKDVDSRNYKRFIDNKTFSDSNLKIFGRETSTAEDFKDSFSPYDDLVEESQKLKVEEKQKLWGQHISKNYQEKRSILVWVMALSLLIAGSVVITTLGIVYKTKSFYGSERSVIDSFWERIYYLDTDWKPKEIDTSAVSLINPKMDPVNNFIVDANTVYAMKNGYLINLGVLKGEYANRKVESVLDGVVMFGGKGNFPFVDLETRQPIPIPKNAEIVDPIGIYAHDLLVARIQVKKNAKTTTVGFDRTGKIIWEYDGYCTNPIQKNPQILMLENCASDKERKESSKKRRILEVRTGKTKEFTLSANEYIKLADDHIYVVDAANNTLRYFDDDLVIVPSGNLDLEEITNYQIDRSRYRVTFNTFDMSDRIKAINILNVINGDVHDYVVSQKGTIHEITNEYKCNNPVFLNAGKRYICVLNYGKNADSTLSSYRVYDSSSHNQIIDMPISGIMARFNKGFAVFTNIAGESKTKFYYIK